MHITPSTTYEEEEEEGMCWGDTETKIQSTALKPRLDKTPPPWNQPGAYLHLLKLSNLYVLSIWSGSLVSANVDLTLFGFKSYVIHGQTKGLEIIEKDI